MSGVAGYRIALQHAARTLGGILQKQDSAAAMEDAEGTEPGLLSSSAPPQQTQHMSTDVPVVLAEGTAQLRSPALHFCLPQKGLGEIQKEQVGAH